MRVESKKPQFTPITLVIENEIEAGIMFALFNHPDIARAIKNYLNSQGETMIFDYEALLDGIENACPNGIKYATMHHMLCDQFSKPRGSK